MRYQNTLRKVLTSPEQAVLRRLKTPQKIQDYLDSLPINFERSGETYMSPRRVLREQTAHCFEGALFAAAALAYHGALPLLLDLRATTDDDDHVVALFRVGRYWGALSKTNHPVLRYREPVYMSVRELAMSFFHEYFTHSGIKTLREYAAPFDLSRIAPERWVTAEEELFWLVEALDKSRHFSIAPRKNLARLRRAHPLEIRATALTEWREPKKRS